MQHTDKSGRLRIALLGGIVALLLGGTMLSGLVQRFVPPARGDAEPADVDLATITLEAKRTRAIRQQMADLAHEGKWNAAITAADKALAEKPSPFISGLRAEAFLLSGHWEQGRQDFADMLPERDWLMNAARLQYTNDHDGYRQFCEQTMAQIDIDKIPPMYANNAAWICALGPRGLTDYTKPLQLAAKAVAVAAPEERSNSLNTLGAVLLRMGRSQEALERFSEAEKGQSNAFNWAFMALAENQLGHVAEARQWRDRLRKRVNDTFGTLQQQDARHELLLFLHEVETSVH